ncbi:hypothetical protein IFM61606_00344 [Aspergillus udagawae]|uniref:Altered inheritance of mitochondria protein 11 n=1 Tax=Aspergillus udagawae TaxID=91492 RepID=A0A8H3NKN4_9EURO|nr:hypothetical protein IFM46972_03269 [Aspergillus udagawae]GFF37654.1 hypothetical protein IFM51744_03536 [Aspergillus udagawae]GFF86424.1 hypothetical protein IFM53868_04807 [Aspergillus udagawae]GFG15735.1 hypothetical protein IFM5058_07603 [Aspergillus udagawae]GFG20110.1 hypothetical protein IFM61606_00344 [Aspergillus udagawae]
MLSFFNWGPSPSPTTDSKTTSSAPSQPDSNSGSTGPQPQPQPTQLQPQKHLTNLKLLFGGVTFFTLSLLITRRAFSKRVIASTPPYWTSSVYHRPPVNGAGDAFEALSLATLNVCSFAMMATGGVLYALDINSVEDMRRYVKKEMGTGTVRDEEVEREVEEWVTKVLGEKFGVELKKEKEETANAEKKGE